MRSEEVEAEVAGLIGRLGARLRNDPNMARAMLRDDQDNSVDTALSGIEDAILGLVMLHIQLRRSTR